MKAYYGHCSSHASSASLSSEGFLKVVQWIVEEIDVHRPEEQFLHEVVSILYQVI